jgi:hypothetical protein
MILGLLLGIIMWGLTANAAQSAITCDRECLRGKVTQLLYAFLKYDVIEIPVAGTLRASEDAVEKPFAKVGLVRTEELSFRSKEELSSVFRRCNRSNPTYRGA